jgi:energy-coupling factor transporter ATP-binding protein EcfA2
MSRNETTAGCGQPFIGLRPFEYDDRKYFFGREEELDLLEFKVKGSRFVAVVGKLGCGKSSLISAGLRARLGNDTDRWHWAEMRPGDAPIRGLASVLSGLAGETGDLLEAGADRFERILTKSSFGIGEALGLIPALGQFRRSRVLLFVDQFENLFRFANLGSERRLDAAAAAERRDEASAFIRLLLTAMKSQSVPIHLIVSMRSNDVGSCAGFYGLAEAVGRSQFLVPAMTRDQREDVIRKPVQLAGGEIDPGLVQQALNDTNDDPDQLPNLQHTMMRCWQRAYQRGKRRMDGNPRLTIGDYMEVAGVASAYCPA